LKPVHLRRPWLPAEWEDCGSAIVAQAAEEVIASYLDAERDQAAPVGSGCRADDFQALLR